MLNTYLMFSAGVVAVAGPIVYNIYGIITDTSLLITSLF